MPFRKKFRSHIIKQFNLSDVAVELALKAKVYVQFII